MDISRKLGIGIVMIIPAFVGSGALWHIFNNWLSVLVWLVIIAGGFGIMMKKYSGRD